MMHGSESKTAVGAVGYGRSRSFGCGPHVSKWGFATIAAIIVVAVSIRPASAGLLLLDTFTNVTSPVGDFGGTVTRSNIGFAGGVSISTGFGEARLTADNVESPPYSGLNYTFSPSANLLSSVILTARNRQTSSSETGLLSVRTTTSTGTYTISQTLPGNTPTFQTYTFDFTNLAGPTMTLQQLEVIWDMPSGGTGLRGLAISQIDLVATPIPEIDPATGSSALSLVAGVLAMIEQRRRRATLVA
jgi:hypothetical protein